MVIDYSFYTGKLLFIEHVAMSMVLYAVRFRRAEKKNNKNIK